MEKNNFFEILESSYSCLRKSEKLVADYVKEYPKNSIQLSITELARSSNVSEATVNRFCRSIGYLGYGQMKIALSQQIVKGAIRNIPKDINEDDTINSISEKLNYSLKSVIENTYENCDISSIENTVSSIKKADRLYIFGIGGSGAVAKIAHHLFLKAGIINYYYEDGYMQAVAAATLNKRDVVIGISHSGKTKDVIEAMQIAKEKNATTIAITGNKGSNIIAAADLCLFTYSKEEPIYGDFMEAKVSQLYIIDLLYINIVIQDTSLHKDYLEETAKAVWKRSF